MMDVNDGAITVNKYFLKHLPPTFLNPETNSSKFQEDRRFIGQQKLFTKLFYLILLHLF